MFWNKKEICSVCHNAVGSTSLKDGYICKDCISKCSMFILPFGMKSTSVQKIQDAIMAVNENQDRQKLYSKTQSVENYFEVDETHGFWKADFIKDVVFRNDEIVNFELLENGEIVTKGGLDSAVIGAALFGSTGALAGSILGSKKKQEITEYRIRISTNHQFIPEVYINFLTNGKISRSSLRYNSYNASAQRIISLLSNITLEKEKPAISQADEILKFKNLLDAGIITQDEFELKKKQLLNL